MELIYNSKVSDKGKLVKYVSDQIANDLKGFVGKNITITITDEISRTTKQNRLWWLYVGILSNETGYDKNEMHEQLKSQFMPFAKSTTELSTKEFSDMVNQIVRWSAETLSVILPYEETPEA